MRDDYVCYGHIYMNKGVLFSFFLKVALLQTSSSRQNTNNLISIIIKLNIASKRKSNGILPSSATISQE